MVRSRAGRDAGRFFLVVGIRDQHTAVVADGNLRPVSRPKIKNVKHLDVFPIRMKEAAIHFAASSVVTNKIVARAIGELLAELRLSTSSTAATAGGANAGAGEGGGRPEEDARGYG